MRESEHFVLNGVECDARKLYTTTPPFKAYHAKKIAMLLEVPDGRYHVANSADIPDVPRLLCEPEHANLKKSIVGLMRFGDMCSDIIISVFDQIDHAIIMKCEMTKITVVKFIFLPHARPNWVPPRHFFAVNTWALSGAFCTFVFGNHAVRNAR